MALICVQILGRATQKTTGFPVCWPANLDTDYRYINDCATVVDGHNILQQRELVAKGSMVGPVRCSDVGRLIGAHATVARQ